MITMPDIWTGLNDSDTRDAGASSMSRNLLVGRVVYNGRLVLDLGCEY